MAVNIEVNDLNSIVKAMVEGSHAERMFEWTTGSNMTTTLGSEQIHEFNVELSQSSQSLTLLDNRTHQTSPHETDQQFLTLPKSQSTALLTTDKKNFVLPHCDKEFTDKIKFIKYLHEHVPEKNQTNCSVEDVNNLATNFNRKVLYRCHISGCGKFYGKLDHLKRHLDWHEGVKNFACPHCDKKFLRKDHLNLHIRRHGKVIQREAKNGSVNDRASQNLKLSMSSKIIRKDKNATKMIFSSRLQQVCQVPGCRRIFIDLQALQRHLEWHKDNCRITSNVANSSSSTMSPMSVSISNSAGIPMRSNVIVPFDFGTYTAKMKFIPIGRTIGTSTTTTVINQTQPNLAFSTIN